MEVECIHINNFNPHLEYLLLGPYKVNEVELNGYDMLYTAVVCLNSSPTKGPVLAKLPTQLVASSLFQKTNVIDFHAKDHILEALIDHSEKVRFLKYSDTFISKDNKARFVAALDVYDEYMYQIARCNVMENRVNAIKVLRHMIFEVQELVVNDMNEYNRFRKSEGCLEELLNQEIEYRVKHICARKIQRMWRRCNSDPHHELCRRRLLWEFHEMDA
jgi:hypothetical protein